MLVSEVIYKVKVRMQELTPFGEGLAVTDPSVGDSIPVTDGLVVLRPERYEKPIETYIKECLNEAYKLLSDIAPDSYLPVKSFTGYPEKRQDGSGVIDLPVDFYRLKLFRLVGWERPVTDIIEVGSDDYLLQFNRYARGGISRPVCAVRNMGDKKVLEYFSLPEYYSEHVVDMGLYVPVLSLENEDGVIPVDAKIDIDEHLIVPFIYFVASRVYSIYELAEIGDVMMRKGLESLNGINIKG